MKYISDYFRRQHGYFAFCFLILVPVILDSCKNKEAPAEATQSEEATPDTLPDDFVAFYDRFHTDSQYQMDHIIFPLEGLPASTGEDDTVMTQRFFWQRDGWKKHSHFTDPSNQFEHWYQVLDERIIEHWIKMKGTNLVMRRRFAKLDDEWFLIYYSGLRPETAEE